MKTISQRDLRNGNAEVIREVERGESFIVTRNRVPVAQLTPLDPAGATLPLARPAKHRFSPSRLHRILSADSAAILDDLRGDR